MSLLGILIYGIIFGTAAFCYITWYEKPRKRKRK